MSQIYKNPKLKCCTNFFAVFGLKSFDLKFKYFETND